MNQYPNKNAIYILLSIFIFIVSAWLGVFILSSSNYPRAQIAASFSTVLCGLHSAFAWALSAMKKGEENSNIAAAGLSGATAAYGMTAIEFPDKINNFTQNLAIMTWYLGVLLGSLLILSLIIDEIIRFKKFMNSELNN